MEQIKKLLLNLKGVKTVFQIPKSNRKKVGELEKNYERNGVVGLKNVGMELVLQCDIVFAILKDASFRLPPGATVIMVEDHNDENEQTDHLIKIDSREYRVIGEEIIDKNPPEGKEEYIFISDDFILYPGRRKGHSKKPAYFLIPPLGFSELEKVKDKYNIDNIISVSPSTLADDYIRDVYNLSTSEKLATILVGFDKTT